MDALVDRRNDLSNWFAGRGPIKAHEQAVSVVMCPANQILSGSERDISDVQGNLGKEKMRVFPLG